MNNQHTIYCPECNALLDKRTVDDGEIIEKYCSKCKINWIIKVEVNLTFFTKYKKEQ